VKSVITREYLYYFFKSISRLGLVSGGFWWDRRFRLSWTGGSACLARLRAILSHVQTSRHGWSGFVGQAVSACLCGVSFTRSQGTGQPNLKTQIVKGTLCPLPPLTDQMEILARLRSDAERSRASFQSIDAAINLLREYRAALIKMQCS
jgi:hypothetical protein